MTDSRASKRPVPTARLSPTAERSQADETAPEMTRAVRGKMRTRGKLIEAAMLVMGRKGVDGATIAEITEEADVGFGSFYNHFKSKEAIAEAVFDALNEELAAKLDQISSGVDDTAMATSIIQHVIIRKAVVDPVWGWFLVHAQSALKSMERTYHERAVFDLERGNSQGRFSLSNVDMAATVTLTSLMGVVRAILEGASPPEAARDLVELMLRMYGVAHDEARRISRERIPAAYRL